MHATDKAAGFTLIELAIVLVIIGLIVGGILVGQDLIHAAGVRAQVTQIEKYNTAANTFRGKFNYLPGDIKDPDASSFGFQPRGSNPGQGDGNGVIQGNCNNTPTCGYGNQESGEALLFWSDLSAAHLVDGTFSSAAATTIATSSGAAVAGYLPVAKIERGNYVYVWSGGFTLAAGGDGINYFGLAAVSTIGPVGGCGGGCVTDTPGLTVLEASMIDKKADDGLPQTGAITAVYLSAPLSVGTPVWAAGGGGQGTADTSATTGSATTCYDNSNVGSAIQQYSVEIKNGANVNCALSFRFQ